MRVAVRHADRRERLAAIDGPGDLEVHHVHRVLVRRIRRDGGVIERANLELLVTVDARPTVASVVGAEDATGGILRFDAGVDPPRVCGGDGNADLADGSLGHAGVAGDFRPAIATVGGLPQAAPPAARLHAPRQALELVHRREQDAWIDGIDGDVVRARGIVEEEDLPPGAAAVRGAEYATLRIGSECVAHRCDVDAIRIARIDAHRADLLRTRETEVVPREPGVGGAVDARAIREVLAELRLAASCVDDIRIGLRDGDGADGRDVGAPVGDVVPALAGVCRLPDATVHGAKVVDKRPRRIASYRVGPAAAEGADVAPPQRLEVARREGAVRVQGRIVQPRYGWRIGAGSALGGERGGEGKRERYEGVDSAHYGEGSGRRGRATKGSACSAPNLSPVWPQCSQPGGCLFRRAAIRRISWKRPPRQM